jgi:hypothetical protein
MYIGKTAKQHYYENRCNIYGGHRGVVMAVRETYASLLLHSPVAYVSQKEAASLAAE